MPTIDQLQPVIVASDDDQLPVSQGGIVRRVSRAQFLAGTQSTLSLNPGLLGRTSAGFGSPEPIAVGGGLTLSNGVLSGPARFAVSALPQSASIASGDLVAVSKSGVDAAVPVSAILSAAGADVSGQVVKASNGSVRKLSDWVGDALAVEGFGAVGDGVTDDSPAFARALASGQPIRLGAKTYRVDGQWTIAVPAFFVGTPGATALRRTRQSGGAWITIAGPSFTASGVTFDAGGLPDDSWAVQVMASCTTTLFDACTFANAGGPTLGCGLTIQARDGLSGPGSSHTIRNCTFRNNAVHGLWIQAACGALVEGCTAFQNGSFGFCLDFNDPTFLQIVRHCSIIACRSWANARGISVGNYNQANSEPPVWGPGNPDARDVLIADNVCFNNSAYGIAASGLGIQLTGNRVWIDAAAATASGFLFNASQSRLSGNSAFGPGQFGVDAGGCVDAEIADNVIVDFQVGINAGGGTAVRVGGNQLLSNTRAITAFQVETDGAGNNFGIACSDLQIDGNRIDLSAPGAAGVLLFDGPQNVLISANQFTSTDATGVARAVSILTDQATLVMNRWNNAVSQPADTVQIAGLTYLRAPDIADRIAVTASGTAISGLIGQQQFELMGQISFIRVTQGGSAYTHASVTISGSGSGAQAQAYIRDGAIIGIALVAGGSGYTANTQVAIVGDGQGGAASAVIGLSVLEGRRVTLACSVPISLLLGGSVAPFDNWTGGGLSIPARSEVVCVGSGGSWRAVSFVATDYLSPAADGSVSLRSAGGDVALRPRGAGVVRVASDTEASGFSIRLGRGSPEGVIAAPPGSDYRNLDGGAGQTFWLKRTGAGNTGWFALG